MNITQAMDESRRAFRWAQRHIPIGEDRDIAFAVQASILLERLEALGVVREGEVVAGSGHLAVDHYEDLVDVVRMGGKNIAKAQRLYGWSARGAPAQYERIFPVTVRS